MNLRSGACTGFEVLARWQHDERGTLLPGDFIPHLEQAGAIAVLTRSLLAQVFEDALLLPEDCGFAVNISPLQLNCTAVCNDIRELSERFGFDLKRLTVEVTESALIENYDQARTILTSLKELGAKLALDDFGTGYSSLTHLNALPFDEIKVDQSFVRNMSTRKDSRKIVAAVIGLGSSLGLGIIAEGVEEPFQAEMLARLGCERAQGWLFGKPLSIAETQEFLHGSALFNADPAASEYDPAELCLEALPAARYAHLRAIYDGAPVGLCFIDRDLRYVNLNRRLAELNRIPLEQHLGRRMQEVTPAVYERVHPYLDRVIHGEAIIDLEYQVQHHPGSPTQTRLASYQPALDEDGEVVGISVAVIDVTARREAEERLKESEDHYHSMVELNPLIPWTLSPSGQTTDLSAKWTAFTGQDVHDALGAGWLAALHPEDRERAAASCMTALSRNESFQIEYRVGKGDGVWHWLRSRGTPRFGEDGAPLRWYGVAECIDAEKQQTEELRLTVERLQAIIDAIPMGILVAEAPSGRVLNRNPAAQSLLRRKNAASRDDDAEDAAAYYCDGRKLPATDFPMARAMNAGTITRNQEVFYDPGEGEGKWLLLGAAPVRDAHSLVVGAVATVQERPPCSCSRRVQNDCLLPSTHSDQRDAA